MRLGVRPGIALEDLSVAVVVGPEHQQLEAIGPGLERADHRRSHAERIQWTQLDELAVNQARRPALLNHHTTRPPSARSHTPT